MSFANKLVWSMRRVLRMSPREIGHRLAEVGRKSIDRRSPRGWTAFGQFDGPLNGLEDAVENWPPAPDRSISGRLNLLNQDWPDPKQIDWWNGDIWRLDPVSGRLWPGAETFAVDISYRDNPAFGDVKFVWELNRLQFLPSMAAGKEAGETALAILEAWMQANPPGRGINWTSGIEAASRLVSVLAMLRLQKRRLSPRSDRLIRAFIEAHLYWIARYPSLHSSANNHRVAELAALYIGATAAPGMLQAARDRVESRAGLEREILRQFHPDGVGAEQSPTYAAYALEWFWLGGMTADASHEPMSPVYRARAAAAADHLRWMIDDGGRAPRIGDDDEGRVLTPKGVTPERYPQSVVERVEQWLGRKQDADAPSATGVRSFCEGGYSIARTPTSLGTALFVFDHGPLGYLSIAAHGHADALSVWLHWGDEPILVDAGTRLYHSGRGVRDAYRGTAAHNTLTLDGENQSRIAGPFNWSEHADVRLIKASTERIEAEHTGYRKRHGLIHARSVDFTPSGYVIEDRLIGRPRSVTPWRLGYLLHPSLAVELVGGLASVTSKAGRKVEMETEAGPDWRIEEALYSPGFNQSEPTRRLALAGAFEPGSNPVASRVSIRLHP